MNDCLDKQCSDLERAISRLDLITSHDAFVLLRASFIAPALQHTLRASPCNGHEALTQFDNLQRIALCKICNVSLLMTNGCRPAYLLNLTDWVFVTLHHWHHHHSSHLMWARVTYKIRSCSVSLKCLTKWLNLISRLGVTSTPNLYQINHQQPNNDLGTNQ